MKLHFIDPVAPAAPPSPAKIPTGSPERRGPIHCFLPRAATAGPTALDGAGCVRSLTCPTVRSTKKGLALRLLAKTKERDHQMSKSRKTRSTRLNGRLDEKFEKYCDERGMSNAEGLRTLVREGINENDDSQDPPPIATMITSLTAVLSLLFSTIALTVFAIASQTALAAAVGAASVLWLVVSSSLLLSGGARRLDEYLEKRSRPQQPEQNRVSEGGKEVDA